ncbi:MAG: hypothetical protein FJ044_05750, partial [Candidatus Cloacimonetes bacterium]|nr:hypothetical protein [Candidatus Cloacimonadota bacterium]
LAGGYNYINETRNSGIAYERQLTSQYLDNQNDLSAYVSGFYEQVGVAQAQSDVLDSVLLDAVKGRYDKGGFAANSPMFAAIAEAYPEAGLAELMANWGKIQDYISAGREGYRATQSKLLDQLRTYDTWRRTGIFRSTVVRMLGFPSNDLEARVGEMVFTGEAARNKMYQIVLTSEAIEAYEKGIMEPLQVPERGQ